MNLVSYFAAQKYLNAISICVCLLGCPAILPSQEPMAKVKSEVSRLEQAVTANFSESEDDRKTAQDYLAALENVESQLKAGYFYLGLEQLHGVYRNLMTTIYQRSRPEISSDGQEAFDREWERVDEVMKQKEKAIAATKSELPAAVQAIAEASLRQARPYYRSSRLMSMNTNVRTGLYYLGRAQANLDFTLFCRKLEFSEVLPAPVIPSLEPELTSLEERVVAGYQEPGFGKEEKEKRYNRFISTNVTIKMVRELEQKQLSAGALYKYLEALFDFEIIDRMAPAIDDLQALKTTSKSMFQKLASGEMDHSIGLLYWQMAQADLDNGAADGESLVRCAVILERVLPEYFRLIEAAN